MTKRRIIRTVLGAAALSGSFALVGSGCSDNTEEKLRAAKLAQTCSINSDCEGDLVCVFERCHIACNEDEDCTDPLRCVRGLDGGTNVCQLDDEVACERDRNCPGEQVCGVDEECRDSCHGDEDCIGAQICAASDECASTDPDKDELDEERNLVPKASGTGGAAGASGVGGASSTGGSTDSGGAGGTLGAAGEGASAGEASGSAGEASGSAGEASGGSDSGPPDEYVESSDGVEAVNNDDREHAIPASEKSSLFFTFGDQDWLAVSTPDDGRAHVLELGLQQESGLRTGVEALAGVDFASIGLATTQAGVTTKVYITVGPATTTLLRFWPYSGVSPEAGKRLELTIQTSPEQDDHEPNNTRETATNIELNTQISAWLVNPFVSATDKAIDDWYAVELDEGAATLALLEVPSAGRIAITRENEQGVVAAIQTPQIGVTGEWPIAVPVTGTYLIHFTAYTGFLPFAEGLKPSHLEEPYKFEVRQ